MNKLNITKRKLLNSTTDMRSNNLIPGVIFGSQMESAPIKMTAKELSKKSHLPGEIYEVEHDGEKVMVRFGEIQVDPLTRNIIHFSLFRLPKGEKSHVNIPVELTGRAEGVKNGGVVVLLKDSLDVVGYPRKMPDKLKADVSSMEIGDKLTVAQLRTPKSIDLEEDKSEVVAICRPPSKAKEVLDIPKESKEDEFPMPVEESISKRA